MIINTFIFQLIDSRMYVIIEDDEALVIDPCENTEAFELLKSRKISWVNIILTHEHYDHISGVNAFRKQFKCNVICSEICGKKITDSRGNLSKYFEVLIASKAKSEMIHIEPFKCYADVTFRNKMQMVWKKHRVSLIETPGHSEGSICIEIDSEYLFTGDSLLKNNTNVTKIIGGNQQVFELTTKPILKSYEHIYVYPGHGDSGWIEEFNI